MLPREHPKDEQKGAASSGSSTGFQLLNSFFNSVVSWCFMFMAPHLASDTDSCYLPRAPACESAATHEDTTFHVRQRLFGEAAVVETLLGSVLGCS